MKLITVTDVAKLIKLHGFDNFIYDLMTYLKSDFSRWHEFDKSPRHATHVDGGVIELMPVSDKQYYTFKYVNGHPKNPFNNKQTVVATGQLSRVTDGYPLMFSEMTVLTALRTAATSAIATDYLARDKAQILALIGTGAQSEFQVLAHQLVRDIKQVRYFDVDSLAMRKFADNMANYAHDIDFVACADAKDAVTDADIIILCTACKGHVEVVKDAWLKPGVHINGLGGDCPGKTELEKAILLRSKTVVEYLPQSLIEGEIQLLSHDEATSLVHAELWQLITGAKVGRVTADEISVFDSVGFALEDFSVLRLVYELTNRYDIGRKLDFIPQLTDPKNLVSVLDDISMMGSQWIAKLA
jgi:ornithine cyclodeaminase